MQQMCNRDREARDQVVVEVVVEVAAVPMVVLVVVAVAVAEDPMVVLVVVAARNPASP